MFKESESFLHSKVYMRQFQVGLFIGKSAI